MRIVKLLTALGLGLALSQLFGHAQTTAFSYQGRLLEGGVPVSGIYDLRFTLYDSPTNPAPLSPAIQTAPVPVEGGLFTVTLDFGPGVFSGPPRWLEIAVRPNGSAAAYTPLEPRQWIAPTPYALHAQTASNLLGRVSDSQLSANIPRLNSAATFTGSLTFNPSAGPPFAVGNTSRVANLNADLLDGFDSSSFARSNHAHSAGEITSGVLADARLSANVPLLNRAQTFTGSNSFSGVITATNSANILAGNITGNGAGLSNLPAANMVGVLSDSSLPSTVARLGSNQTFSGAVTFNPASGAPFAVSRTNHIANLNADLLDGLNAGAFWRTGGNTNAGDPAIMGTLENATLELRANNLTALRLIPNALGPSMVVGGSFNTVGAGSGAATIAGGANNSVSNNYAFIGGGSANKAMEIAASVLGGINNTASGYGASVPGGLANVAAGAYSLAAGSRAEARHQGAMVWSDASSAITFTSTAPNQVLLRAVGGVGIGTNAPQAALHVSGTMQADGLKLPNGAAAGSLLVSDSTGMAGWQPAPVRALTNAASPSIVGGFSGNYVPAGVLGATIGGGGNSSSSNQVNANYGTVAGGRGNSVSGTESVISGGLSNIASGIRAVVAGGQQNTALGNYSVVVGGETNRTSASHSAIGGGQGNLAGNAHATVAGGRFNVAGGNYAAIGGGNNNQSGGFAAAVAGGDSNQSTGNYGAIAGGQGNRATALFASVGGGLSNYATNNYATVPGGFNNIAGGNASFAAGVGARALHTSSFVWADTSTGSTFDSTGDHQFLIRATGGVGIGAPPLGALLDVEGDLRLNDHDLLLRGSTDMNHGLGWYGSGREFSNISMDGPVLYGWARGGLGTVSNGVQRLALTWNANQNVGIGTTLPRYPLSVESASSAYVASFKFNGANDTGIAIDAAPGRGALLTWAENGVGRWHAYSDSVSGNFQLHDGLYRLRLAVTQEGKVGMGTPTPNDHLEIFAPNATVRIRNQNDPGGAFMVNTFSNLQMGLYAPTNASFGAIPAGEKRAFFGINNFGQVGSLEAAPGNPQFRNLLDDGSGNMIVDLQSQNTGAMSGGALLFGDSGSGEGIASKRTSGGNQYGLDFYTLFSPRLSIANNGNIGIGNSTPPEKFWVETGNSTVGVMRSTSSGGTWFGIENGSAGGQRWSIISTGSGNGEGAGRLLFFTHQSNDTKLRLEPNGDLVADGTLTGSSDRNRKQGFGDINPREILEKVAGLKLTTWSYKHDERQTRHLGPMAQDFHAAFQVGVDDKHISMVDADGVALAAIQGLNHVVAEKDKKIGALENEVAALRAELRAQQDASRRWEQRLQALEQRLTGHETAK